MSNNHLLFDEAREYVQKIALKSTGEWKKWSKGKLEGKDKRPDFIPSNPDVVYRFKGWKSWSDWIGTDRKINYLPFEEARIYVRNLKLKNFEEWKRYYQKKIEGLEKPENIPWNPQSVYENEWQGTRDWIGTEWKSFKEARIFVRNLNLSGQNEWKLYSKGELEGHDLKPNNIPSDPKRVYPEWVDLGDWLGTERKRTGSNQNVDDTWLSYEEAKNFVHSLGLSGYNQWKAYIAGDILNISSKPRNIPKAPDFVYKNDGWSGWDDWLGERILEQNIIEKEPVKRDEGLCLVNIYEDFIVLKQKYNHFPLIVDLLEKLYYSTDKNSLIELDLPMEIGSKIEEILFKFEEKPTQLITIEKAFIGLIFLLYIFSKLKNKITYSSIWSFIAIDLKSHSNSTFFLDNFFRKEPHPKFILTESIERACKVFNLRNVFKERADQKYIRNTILLQIGLIDNSLNNLKLWLSNYNLPVVVSELLDSEDENYSKLFTEGWRALRRYRDNIIDNIKLKSLLSQNIWFAHLTLDNLLTLSKQRVTTHNSMLIDDEELPIFYLDKIKYDSLGLQFIIDVQDLYTLNLSGLRYELYIDDKYVGLLIADSKKHLILEKNIEILNPTHNQIEIQVKNEDSDVVFSEEITLFDFNEQIIIFDEDGNIYQNIFKKLNATKKYHILMDSDLDCNFNKVSQKEFFDGYAVLVTDIKKDDNCEISYDGESLFELNFTKYIEKPQWLDQLVLYSKNDNSFIVDDEYEFIVQIFNIEEEGKPLESLPIEVKIIKWNYAGGYIDSNDIKNCRVNLNLYSEMITNAKHTLFIKYKGKVFKKVIQCGFFEKNAIPRLFMIDKEGESSKINSSSLLNVKNIESNKFYLSDFKRREVLFLKNKSKFYQTIKPNKLVKLKEFDGFGEDIFISEHLFNSNLNKLFNYVDIEKQVYLNQKILSKLFIKKELPPDVIFTVLDKNMVWHKFTYDEIQSSLKNNFLELDYEIAIGLIIFRNEIIDGFYALDFLDSFSDLKSHEVVKILFLSNYPLLLKQRYTSFIRDYIYNNTIEFFKDFYSRRITMNGILIKLDFSKYTILIEHICMGFTFGKENASFILEEAILNKKVDYLIETPIILFKLLEESKSQTSIRYFDNLLSEVELKDERDSSFVDKTISNLFDSTIIKGIEKHNFKVAMHHINGQYYLREALRKI